jgi:hypothetical protein
MARCAETEPALRDVEGRIVACHLYDAAADPAAVQPEGGRQLETETAERSG